MYRDLDGSLNTWKVREGERGASEQLDGHLQQDADREHEGSGDGEGAPGGALRRAA